MDRVNRTPANLIFLVILVYLAGCYPGVNSIESNTVIDTSHGITPTPYNDTLKVQKPSENTCLWPAKEVTSTSVENFYWSDDGNDLIFQKQDDLKWYVFSISSHDTREYSTNIHPTPTFEYGEFISPDKRFAVNLHNTPNGYAVYFREIGQNAPLLIGNIKGQFGRSDWIHQGKALLLAVQWNSRIVPTEAYVYMVDTSSKTVQVIIPLNDEYKDIEYLGVTPDESKIMFTSYSKEVGRLQFWDIADNTREIESVPVPISLKWLSPQEFLAVGYGVRDDVLRASIYWYNIENGQITDLLPAHTINMHPYVMNAAQISPNGKTIAYVDEEHQTLYIVDCSEVIP